MKVVAAIEGPNTLFQGKDVGVVNGIGEIGVEVNGAENLSKVLKTSKADVFSLILQLLMQLLKPSSILPGRCKFSCGHNRIFR